MTSHIAVLLQIPLRGLFDIRPCVPRRILCARCRRSGIRARPCHFHAMSILPYIVRSPVRGSPMPPSLRSLRLRPPIKGSSRSDTLCGYREIIHDTRRRADDPYRTHDLRT